MFTEHVCYEDKVVYNIILKKPWIVNTYQSHF